MRESMLRLANDSSDPVKATNAAKVYFSDLNDMFVSAQKKDQDGVMQHFGESKADLATYIATLK